VTTAHARFTKSFGEVNSWTTLANHSFVALDTIGLSGLPTEDAYKVANRFLEKLNEEDLGLIERRILISHVPFYRPENSDCGTRRNSKPIRNIRGYQYQNMINNGICSRILSILKPDLIISGDDHDDCMSIYLILGVYRHNYNEGSSLEHSIGTFSWLQGNIYPSFGVMSLRGLNDEPYKPDSPSYILDICSLPPQLYYYKWYAVLFGLTVLGIIWQAHKTFQYQYQRIGGGNFIMYVLSKMLETFVGVSVFYFFVLLYSYL
jgi:hypothetical protein